MGPSSAARRFEARLRLYIEVRRVITAVDGSDLLTVASLLLVAAGVGSVAGPGWACIGVGLLLSLLTPIGTALRIFVRGR